MKIINKMGGYDSSLLEAVPDFERLRLGSQAVLLVIPTLTGFFAMFLMLDSYKESSGISGGMIVFISLMWAMIIFLMDRALFMFPKKKSDGQKKPLSFFLVRLIISLTIGFTISHSLLVYMNKGKIDNYLQETVEQKIKKSTEVYDTQINNINTSINQDENTTRKLQNIINSCHEYLTAEETGTKITITINGQKWPTSGLKNSNKPYAENRNTKALQILLDETIKSNDGILKKIKDHKDTLDKIIKQKDDETKNIKQNYVKDYSVRSKIMYKIAFEDFLTTLHTVAWLLLISIVDIVAIMLKTFFPFGIYDNLIEKTEEKFDKNFAKWVNDDSNDTTCTAALNKICQTHDVEPSIITKKVVASGFITGATMLAGMKYWADIFEFLNKFLDFFMKLFRN